MNSIAASGVSNRASRVGISRSALRGRTRRARSRGTARERPGGHVVPARLPCMGTGTSPALLVLFAAALVDISPRGACAGCRTASPLGVPAARLRSERAVGARRASGHAVSAILPRTFMGASPALPVRGDDAQASQSPRADLRARPVVLFLPRAGDHRLRPILFRVFQKNWEITGNFARSRCMWLPSRPHAGSCSAGPTQRIALLRRVELRAPRGGSTPNPTKWAPKTRASSGR